MSDNDHPISPFTESERRQIISDLQLHIREAQQEGDQARVFYGIQAMTEAEYEAHYL